MAELTQILGDIQQGDPSAAEHYLVRQFGEASAGRMRQMWRGGWVGVLLGASMIAAAYWL
jgi:hypothetical protein